DIAYPAFMHEDSSEVVELAKRALEAIGCKTSTVHSGGGSDANIFNGMGIPTVNLAVGYENIHTTKESISISNLVKTAKAVVSIVKEAAK
ncbi:M20/M25/M40 family metallo-hydrolase, partial [Paenibacillus larvae]